MQASTRLLLLGSLLLAVGCEEPVGTSDGKPRARKKATADADAGAPAPELPKIDFQEVEFGESERSRDPFRSFADSFVEEARSQVKSQREVVLDQYSLDDLKLTAIALNANPSRAMLVDPKGKGHIIRRGQFVGRPETVQSVGQSGAAYEVNWRVDRIRAADIVLVREDPTNPDVPSATRIIPLHPEGTLVELE